ncbi:hypothetical protein [Vibrio penaeicida]|uniref:hypothetical protein n=1 Tax=Vibrio penaeicida TaxID=104609 RepID=UPI00157FBBB0|nr:hypothetical protein [Vibrio penaeicida]
MNKILIILGLLILSLPTWAVELTNYEALNGKVSILAPKSFVQLSDELIEIKYPSKNKPIEVLGDETASVTLAFHYTDKPLKPSQIIKAHKFLSASFRKNYPEATWIRDEVIEKNGQKFMVMELITPTIDTKVHNIIYGTSVNERYLTVNFNTTVELSKKWLSIGKKIMESLSVSRFSYDLQSEYDRLLKVDELEQYQKFLSINIKNRYTNAIIYYRDKAALNEAKRIGTVKAFDNFIAAYPNSDWLEQAKYFKNQAK